MLTKDKSDILKGIAAILMLAHHLFGFPGWVIEANSYTGIINTNLRAEEIIGSFGNICVGMFAFLSGYAIYMKRDSYGRTKERVKKIVKVLFIY